MPAGSPTLGFTHLQSGALLTAAREPDNPYDFALVAMPGLPGGRIFEATGANTADLGEEHGHRVLRVCGKGTKVVLVPLPPAVGRATGQAAGLRDRGPVLLNTRGTRMGRHAATRRLRHLAQAAGIQIARAHPHMLRHTFVTTMPGAGAGLRDAQIAARHAGPRTTIHQIGPQQPRPPPELHPGRLHGLRHLTSPRLPRPGPHDRRPALPRGGHLGIQHKGGAGLRLYPRSDPGRRIRPGPCPGGRAARRDASGSAAAAGRDQVAGGQPGGPAGGLHGGLEQQPRRLVFPGAPGRQAPGHEGARDGPRQLLPGTGRDDPARRRLPVQSREHGASLTCAAVY